MPETMAEHDHRRQAAQREAERRAPAHLLPEVGVGYRAEAAGLRKPARDEVEQEGGDVADDEDDQVVLRDRP